MEPIAQLLEILKYTIPALVVFGTAYYFIRQQSEDQQRIWMHQKSDEARKIILPVRLQAYERLTLLCDRIAIPNTLLRIRMPEMTVAELRMSLMIAVSQEFDHNTALQIYVSETLWQIISFAKTDTINLINRASADLDANADAQALVEALFREMEQPGYFDPLQKALMALRTEVGQLF